MNPGVNDPADSSRSPGAGGPPSCTQPRSVLCLDTPLPCTPEARLHFTSSHPARGSHHPFLLFLALQQITSVVLAFPQTATTLFSKRRTLYPCQYQETLLSFDGCQLLLWAHRSVPSLPSCLWTCLKLSDKLDCPSPQPTLRFLIDSTNESPDFQHPLLGHSFPRHLSLLFKPFRRAAFDRICQYIGINGYSQLFL